MDSYYQAWIEGGYHFAAKLIEGGHGDGKADCGGD